MVRVTKYAGKRNPMRVDPQRLAFLRRSFLAAIRGEFAKVQRDVWDTIVTQDMFGLKDVKPLSFNTQWKYLSLDQQVENFQGWMKNKFDTTLLRTNHSGRPWISKFVDIGYQRGILRSYQDTHRIRRAMRPEWYQAQEQQFLRSTLASLKGRGKQRLVTIRAADSLKGVTNKIRQNVTRIVSDGLPARTTPQVLAQRVIAELKGITPKKRGVVINARRGNDARSATIVNTELSGAFSHGQLDALDEMGLEDVTVLAEWVTADDPCPDCEENEGTIWALEDAYSVLPLHPNCRCAWIAIDAEGKVDITADWFV